VKHNKVGLKSFGQRDGFVNTSVAALVCRLYGLYDQSTHLARRCRRQTRFRLRCRGHFLEDVSLHILHEERLRSARSPDCITTTSTASLASHTQFILDSNAKVAGGFSDYGAETDRNAPSNVYVVSSQTNHVNRNRSNCVKFITTVEFSIKATSENIPTIVPTLSSYFALDRNRQSRNCKDDGPSPQVQRWSAICCASRRNYFHEGSIYRNASDLSIRMHISSSPSTSVPSKRLLTTSKDGPCTNRGHGI